MFDVRLRILRDRLLMNSVLPTVSSFGRLVSGLLFLGLLVPLVFRSSGRFNSYQLSPTYQLSTPKRSTTHRTAQYGTGRLTVRLQHQKCPVFTALRTTG